ncbi:MAG: OmpH family outer membrane protein [Flavobacterium sp.]
MKKYLNPFAVIFPKTKFCFFLCLTFVLFKTSIAAQNTAFINEGKILQVTPGYEKAIKKTDSIYQEFAKEIKEKNIQLSNKTSQLLSAYTIEKEATFEQIIAMLNEVDKQKYELLKEENLLLEKQARAKEQEYNEIYKQKVQVILDAVNKKIQEYCIKNKITLLYKLENIKQSIAYYDEKKDITEGIIKLIK